MEYTINESSITRALSSFPTGESDASGRRPFDDLADYLNQISSDKERLNSTLLKIGTYAVVGSPINLQAFCRLVTEVASNSNIRAQLNQWLLDIPKSDAERRVWLLRAANEEGPAISFAELLEELEVRKSFPLAWMDLAYPSAVGRLVR